ncbi:MAG: hypothetical protein MK212_03605 [Saprospiraceae bacterium]|nr:hypothetical protein [Saprospiraceae bacterium]
MQYLNPFRIFDISYQNTVDPATVLRLHTEVTTQLSAYEREDTVYIRGNKMKKWQAEAVLADWLDDRTRAFHRKVLEIPFLYSFLEYGHLNYFGNHEEKHDLWNQDIEFAKFVFPYFADQYSNALLQAIKVQDKKELTTLLAAPPPKQTEYAAIYYNSVSEHISETISNLVELKQQQSLHYMSEREILSHLPDKTIELYNLLPEYFAEMRNNIASEIHSLAVVLNNNHGRDDGAEAVLRQGLKLKLDQSLRQALEQLLKQHKITTQIPTWVLVGGGVILLLFLIKFIENALSN